MSLIHDALKKAGEKEKNGEKKAPVMGSGLLSMENAAVNVGRGIPKRTIILASVLTVVIAIIVYTKLKPKDEAPKSPPKPSTQEIKGTEPETQDVGLLKKRAMEAYKMDDYQTSWNNYTAASKLAPADAEIWNNLGVVSKARGDSVEARHDYEKALELKPEYPEALANLAVVTMLEGNNTKAIELLTKALKLQPAYPEANLHMAVLYDRKGETEQASNYYHRFLEVGGSFPSDVIDSIRDRLMEIEK